MTSPSASHPIAVRRADSSSIAVDLAGSAEGAPVLVCHGLADSRISARLLAVAARDLDLFVIAPDRAGSGDSDYRPFDQLRDSVDDARRVLDACGVGSTAVVGISGGAPFAMACAAVLADRVHAAILVSPLGDPGWDTRGMATGERLSLAIARRAPTLAGRFLDRLAALAKRRPSLFLRLATCELPQVDRNALGRDDARDAFLAGYINAFRHGSRGVAQDLRLLTRPWGFELEAVGCATWIHIGADDTTVPRSHAYRIRNAIPRAELQVHRGHGHFSLLPDAVVELLAPAAREHQTIDG